MRRCLDVIPGTAISEVFHARPANNCHLNIASNVLQKRLFNDANPRSMPLLRKNPMKTKHFILSSILAFAGLAVLAPSIASAAPPHHPKKHKVCKWDARHHHRVCHWVR